MNTLRLFSSMIVLLAFSVGPASAQQTVSLDKNAALRYWSAFAEMRDSGITDLQAKELNQIFDGSVPYDDLKYKDLVEKNRPALETMARATTLANCDWGVEYQLGSEAPVDYVRKALVLGRLNVLYAFHLSLTGDNDATVRALAAGLRFSREVANGGTLFATAAAKSLIVAHLTAVASISHNEGLSGTQRSVLQKVLVQLGPSGLDWQSAMKREFEIPHGLDAQASQALARITASYLSVLNNLSALPELQQMIASAPQPLPNIIPNPEHVLEAKQDLTVKLRQTSFLLR